MTVVECRTFVLQGLSHHDFFLATVRGDVSSVVWFPMHFRLMFYLLSLPLYRLLDSVERYDPQTNTWSTVASIKVGRIGAAASVLDGKIYLAGGYTTNATDKSVTSISSAVECYKPKKNK